MNFNLQITNLPLYLKVIIEINKYFCKLKADINWLKKIVYDTSIGKKYCQ